MNLSTGKLPHKSKPLKKRKLKKWHELEPGTILHARKAISGDYKTGNWNPYVRIAWNKDTCINCNLCWTVCPDGAIRNDEDGNMVGIDQEFCKQCGLCVEACPTKPKSLKVTPKEKREI